MLDVLQGNPHCSAVGETPILVLRSCPCPSVRDGRIPAGDGIGSILRAFRREEEP